ncbi:serine/threonine protein kinase [Candidatus Uabimicrobium amorphum]|uniref:Serine/threonine protein kinase n=1 Tax=Uabimicrobium amorphum TaxID=2596890 RepID=A0A5S9IVF3_UABAM|nr:serine/threonine protein kinase [Candidatus Uabimicrobium amorphum]BBM88240.1 serine/threonine protein kinase [Candidatus Uabimicrobium amorphum]
MQKWTLLGIVSLILIVVGLGMNSLIDRVIKNKFSQELNVNLSNTYMMLQLWVEAQKSAAVSKGLERKVRTLTEDFMNKKSSKSPDEILQSHFLKEIRQHLRPMCRVYGYTDFAIITPQKRIVASLNDSLVGQSITSLQIKFFDRVLQGETILTAPFLSDFLKTLDSNSTEKQALILSGTPLYDKHGEIIASLVFGIQPQMDFSTIFQVNNTSHNYAFDGDGWMLTSSVLNEQIRELGLMDSEHPIFNLKILNPKCNLLKGEEVSHDELAFTYLVTHALRNPKGVNVEGYRDFRGVPVIGAWMWVEDFNIGIASEIDLEKAYATLYSFRRLFWYLFVLVGISGFVLLISLYIIMHFYKKAKAAEQFGQYKIIDRIGKGGMGEVYKASHATLRRITALKLIQPRQVSEDNVKRFEQEVQLTSRLTHPNTIAVYDYGRTPKGIFYYVMEYLPGITLSELVYKNGAVKEGRVVYFLTQVCSSVAEAHSIGLIHRDIKPANIMIGERGGIYDFVKVLDFGLAREINDISKEYVANEKGAIYGSPHYIAPEALVNPEDIDQKCDIYAIGAVGYFLLTGKHVFNSKDPADVCRHQVKTKPRLPSEVLGKPINKELEDIIMRCLRKKPRERPLNAQVLYKLLKNCQTDWGQEKAKLWWRENAERVYTDLDSSKVKEKHLDTITIDFTTRT